MKIGIIVAMDKELDLLIPLLENIKRLEKDNLSIYAGNIGPHEITMIKSGIGKVNAAVSAYKMIKFTNPDLVINSGVAGGISNHTHPLDVVVGKETGYHDVWCGPGTIYGQANECPRTFNAPVQLLQLKSLTPQRTESHTISQGTIVTGDIFITKKEEVEHITKLYPDALATDMESAAIAQTCFIEGVDFIAIRVISDTPGSDDNIAQYNNFWDMAPKHTFEILKSLLDELK